MYRVSGKVPFQPVSIKILTALLLPGSLTAAYAQDASITSPPTRLPPVVVEAPPKKVKKAPRQVPAEQQNRAAAADDSSGVAGKTPVISPTTISTPVSEVPNSVTVITSDQLLEQQRRTVPDALQAVPGLNVVQTGGPGGQTSVFIRGANSYQTKVLIDGVEVSDPSAPFGAAASYDFGQLLTGDISRIEVLRGPQSGLYGADAIGGVISIVTQKGEGAPRAYASAEAGSFGTFNQTTGVSGSEQGFNYAFNILHYRTEDVPVTPAYLVLPGLPRLDNSYDNMTYSTKFGFDLSKSLTLNFVARYSDATLELGNPDEPSHDTQNNRLFSTRGEAVWSLFDGQFKNYFGLAYTDDYTHYADHYYSYISAYEGERIKYDWRGVTEIAPGQVLLTGVERQTYSLDLFPGTEHSGDSAAFAEIQTQWAKRFFFVANIRYDDNDSFGCATTYRIAPAFIIPGTETKLKASYGTGFTAPSLFALYVNIPFEEIANPHLQPEHSTGYDAGFEQPLFGGKVLLGSTYFHNDVTNLINSYEPSLFIYSFENIGHAEMYGAENFVSVAVTPDIKLRAGYTYTIARDEDTGEELLRRPKDKLTFTASWQADDKLKLSGSVNYLGPWADINPVTGANFTAPGYTTVNIAANYAATDRITVFGRIDNLFNVKYEDPSGYLRPGLGVFAGLRVNTFLADAIEPNK